MKIKRFWLTVLRALFLSFVAFLFAFLFLSFALSGKAIAQNAAANSNLRTRIENKTKTELKTWTGSWNLRLRNLQNADDFNQRNLTEFRLVTDLQYRPLENLFFHFAPKFTYRNGFVQTQESSKADSTEWGVKEASANFEATKGFWASAGALDQGKDHPALLFYETAFPALRLKAQWSALSGGIKATVAIPTSSSLSTQTQEFEKVPSFRSGSLFFKFDRPIFGVSSQFGFYQFQDLPLSVATESGFDGNTTTAVSGTNSKFTYDYQGPFARTNLVWRPMKSTSLWTRGEWVKNEKAPSELNQGWRAKSGADFQVSEPLTLSPVYEYFHVEPDAAVAAYNAVWINTNRVGYLTGLEMAYKKTLLFSVYSGERDLVFQTPTQQRERTWFITLETFDVDI